MPAKSEYLSVRIDPETLQALRTQAKRDDRTVSYVVVSVLGAWAKRQKAAAKKSRARLLSTIHS